MLNPSFNSLLRSLVARIRPARTRRARTRTRLTVELLEARTVPATLQVSITPHTLVESTGPASQATGTVTRINTDNSQPLTVNLTNSNAAEVTVPASVVIPANQASTTFGVSAVHDAAPDGTQNVTVTGTARISAPLGLDPTFGGTGSLGQNYITEAVALQPDGKVVTAGLNYTGNSNANYFDFAVSRYNPDGTPDTTFGGSGTVITDVSGQSDRTQAVVVQSDGKIVVAGTGGDGPHFFWVLARYNPDGSLDNSFGSGGKVVGNPNPYGYYNEIWDLALQADGKILAAGDEDISTPSGFDGVFAVARFNTNGTLDATFGSGGVATSNPVPQYSDRAFGIAVQSDGKIVLAGGSKGGNFDSHFALSRFTPAGVLDPTFGSGGTVLTDVPGSYEQAQGLCLLPTGRIVIVGYVSPVGVFPPIYNFALARYNADGSLDSGFGSGGITISDFGGNDSAQRVALQPDGRLVVVGGGITNSNSTERTIVARYTAAGTLESSVVGSHNGVLGQGVALQSDGSIVVASEPLVQFGGYVERYTDFAILSGSDTVAVQDDTAPTAADDAYTLNEGQTLSVAAPGVLANDTDVDGDALTDKLVTGPSHGTVTFNSDGSFTYTPAALYSGPDSFTYKANDGLLDSNTATVAITVNDLNHPPVANDDSYTVNEDSPLSVAAPGVLANDTDVDGDPLTAALVSGPAHGTLILSADGSFTYTPAALYSGPDSFTYKANDGSADSNVATVTITVSHVNHPPVANNDSYSVNEDSSLSVAAPGVLTDDTDVDGDPLTAALVSGPSHGTLTFNADGSLTYTPTPLYSGADSFTYKANDGSADSSVATVSLTVNHVNHAPVANNDSYSLNANSTLTVATPGMLGNDSDVDGDHLTALLASGPAHGTLTLNANGSFAYTPTAGFSGTDQFTYNASDGTATSNAAVVTLTVSPLPATEGKITGDGSIDKGVRKFNLDVQTRNQGGGLAFVGHLHYQDQQKGINLQSTSITFIRVEADGIHATVSGTATVNGVRGYQFTVAVEDNGERGAGHDRFRIQIAGPGDFAYDSLAWATLGSLLDSGNIQVHRRP